MSDDIVRCTCGTLDPDYACPEHGDDFTPPEQAPPGFYTNMEQRLGVFGEHLRKIDQFVAETAQALTRQSQMMELMTAHLENLIERMADIESAHMPWYIALCQQCDVKMPFADEDQHRTWCAAHEQGTGHTVRAGIEWRHR